MEELLELRTYIENGNYIQALNLIGEMEEMSRDDKINKIESYLIVLILHLIKQFAEQRSTRSWEVSIQNAVNAIIRTNKRRKSGGYYLTIDELKEAIDEIYSTALNRASLEVFEGRFSPDELRKQVDDSKIKAEALKMVINAQNN